MPCATHAAVYAQAYSKGEHLGLQVFMVQLRGSDLKPLKGIEGKLLSRNRITT